MKIEEVKNQVLAQVEQPIKFEDIDQSPYTTFQEFILNFFEMANKKKTVYEENDYQQCYSYAARSMGDMYHITKYYFPELTFEEFYVFFYTQYIKDPNCKGHYCGDVKRRVFNNRPYWNLESTHAKDEFGMIIEDHKELANSLLKVTQDEKISGFQQ